MSAFAGNVKSITSISKPYPDGQRVVAAAVEYAEELDGSTVDAGAFHVEGRTVTRAYVAREPHWNADETAHGRFAIIELDPNDAGACTLKEKDGTPKDPRKPRGGGRGPQSGRPGDPGDGRGFGGAGGGRPGRPEGPDDPNGRRGPGGERPGGPCGPRGPKGPGPRGPRGPRGPLVLPDGRVWRGPHGISARRDRIQLLVTQTRTLATAAGANLPAWPEAIASSTEDNGINDKFVQERFANIDYNLFIPQNLEEGVAYPLVLFIHDAGAIGESPLITLEQGIGATVWATPEFQTAHPCFVLAPQHAKELPITNDDYWATDDLETIKKLCDHLVKHFPIDQNRLYATGQSMGFMAICELMCRYPDYLAGALLPAGHWNVARVAQLWDKNVWMFVSDEDRGATKMYALPEAAKQLGGHINVYEWSADQPVEKLSSLVESAAQDSATFRITKFTGDSIWREHQPDRTMGGGHFGTWHLVYQIEAAREWLFSCERK